jgi:excisionase family DNA binding protein
VRGYLDINGAAEYLSVSSRTIRRNLEKISHYRCDFGLRFSKDDLDQYLLVFRKEPSRPAKVTLDDVFGPTHRRRKPGG